MKIKWQKFLTKLLRSRRLPLPLRRFLAKICYPVLLQNKSLQPKAEITLQEYADLVRIPQIYQHFDFMVDFFGIKYCGNSENVIDRYILFYGAFEYGLLYFLRDLTKNLAKKSIFVDIGANTGQHSLFMSQYVSQVHSFEPYKLVYDRFVHMVEINAIDNIIVYPLALGNKEQTSLFYAPPASNLGSGSFLEEHDAKNCKYEPLQMGVGDIEFPKHQIDHVDIVKIDVEGYERFVLEGLTKTFAQNQPIVVLEVSPASVKKIGTYQAFCQSFPSGYKFLKIYASLYADARYFLYPFKKQDFENIKEWHLDVVAYPAEKSFMVPLDNI